MKSIDDLASQLRRIDKRPYPAYRDLRGAYAFEGGSVHIDHVQRDPFAPPSRVRVRMRGETAAFDSYTTGNRSRECALRDYLSRRFARACRRSSEHVGSGKGGLLSMPLPDQEILERSSVIIGASFVEARCSCGLPARGRRVMGGECARLLCEVLPRVACETLTVKATDPEKLREHLDTAEDADVLRGRLAEHGLAAFVADGSCLPRRSGVDDRPLLGPNLVPFAAPDSLRVTLRAPHAGEVTGMGIPRGVTLVVGGGYHGKSTLLLALERGVYNHVPGDGRERVVTDPTAIKIRAEDGRSVERVDITPFVAGLPDGTDASVFSSPNASGSTSQAANTVEAVEAGSRLLLLDEDTCATNLLIRDARMQALVEKSGEPITPFVDRVRQLHEDKGVSCILVIGGSGDYLEVADTVIRMDAYRARDVTAQARKIAGARPTGRSREEAPSWPVGAQARYVIPSSLDPSSGRWAVKLKARGLRAVQFGEEEIDLSAVAQLVDEGQVRALGRALVLLRGIFEENRAGTVAAGIAEVCRRVEKGGLDVLDDRPVADYVAFRAQELAAALNRFRGLRVRVG